MGLLVVFTGPSGTGKTTICEMMLKRYKQRGAARSISSTTRRPRLDEVDGIHYRFISRETFEQQIGRGEFFEYAAPYGTDLYGTNGLLLDKLFSQWFLVFAVLDIQGCRQVKNKSFDSLIIPIIPQNKEESDCRIRERPGATPDDIERRRARFEAEYAAIASGEFGQPIINRNGYLDETVEQIQARIEPCLR